MDSSHLMTLHSRPERLSGWGRFPVLDCSTVQPQSCSEASRSVTADVSGAIARGNGRSYGDSSVGADLTIQMRKLGRFLSFDDITGVLIVEAGVMLADLVRIFVPRGWFPPATPGTQFVTVGGMVASDIHGKNHHSAGSFCDHVSSLDLAVGEGEVFRCSATENAELFRATCGGMGLTGIILSVTFQMVRIPSSRIDQTLIRAFDLRRTMDIFDTAEHITYSVAWIDCLAAGSSLGRSVVTLGEHAPIDSLSKLDQGSPFKMADGRSKRLPLDFPGFALNKFSVSVFNELYYRLQRVGRSVVPLEHYFYPLDALQDWNRIYGKSGFLQYQCVIPLEASRDGIRTLLKVIAEDGQASFLAVLKKFGPGSFGYLSFPMPGYTLALDFSAKPGTLKLLERLDAIVSDHGGRLYLAKDARMSSDMMARGYPALDHFRSVRRRYGLSERFNSVQSSRLGI